MNRKRPIMKILAAALILASLIGLAVAVSGANGSDPLVTLSYLTGTFKQNLLSEVETAVAAGQKKLSSDMEAQITGLQSSLAAPKTEPAAVEFETVTLTTGQSYSLAAGAQVLFLSGPASAKSAGLSDTTDGKTVGAGGSLTANHLYLASGGCGITASGSVKLMVRQ